MNGRVYDPSVGRMTSSDPAIPDPYNGQAYNHYAYVYNNPLNATDPMTSLNRLCQVQSSVVG